MMTDVMLHWLLLILQNLAEPFLLMCVCNVFLKPPKQYVIAKYTIVFLTSIAYCIILNLATVPNIIRYTVTFIVFFLYTLFFGGRVLQRLFALVCSFFLTALVSATVYWLIDLLSGKRATALSLDSFLYGIPNVLALTAAGFLILAWRKSKDINNSLSPVQWVLMMLYPMVACFVIMSLYSISVFSVGRQNLMILDALALMAAMVGHFVLLYMLNEQNSVLERNKMTRQAVELSQEKAEALLEAYNEQRRMTHDFSNQLTAIQGLLSQGKQEECKALIQSILPTVYAETPVINTHNPLIDTMLSQKYMQAKKQGIVVFFALSNLKNTPVPAPDMVVLIGNLFDNAIEASKTVEEPEIQVKIQLTENDFVLSFRNRVEHKVDISADRLPISTKGIAGHGYGLQNVLELLKKNKMEYAFSCDNTWFQISALTYL